jgi:hypothetical protein
MSSGVSLVSRVKRAGLAVGRGSRAGRQEEPDSQRGTRLIHTCLKNPEARPARRTKEAASDDMAVSSLILGVSNRVRRVTGREEDGHEERVCRR